MAKLILPTGVSLHNGKLRIAFRPAGFKNHIRRSLGILPTKNNIKIAEMKRNAIQHDIMLGKFDIGEHFPNDPLSKTTPLYIRKFLEIYHLARGNWKPQSRDNHDGWVNSLELAMGERCDIKRFTVADAVKLQQDMFAVRRAYAVNNYMAILSKACKRAVVAEILESNPFQHLEALTDKTSNQDEAALTESQVYTIEEAELVCKALRSPHKRRLFTFLFWSGIRHGEAAALTREDICLPYITIKRNISRKGLVGTPKTGQARRILLPSLAVSVITKQLESHTNDQVWARDNGTPFVSSKIITQSTWRNAVKKAGLRLLVPYVTRHSFASWMLRAGSPELVIASHLGHSSLVMLRTRYAHFIPEDKQTWSIDNVVDFSPKMEENDPEVTPRELEIAES